MGWADAPIVGSDGEASTAKPIPVKSSDKSAWMAAPVVKQTAAPTAEPSPPAQKNDFITPTDRGPARPDKPEASLVKRAGDEIGAEFQEKMGLTDEQYDKLKSVIGTGPLTTLIKSGAATADLVGRVLDLGAKAAAGTVGEAAHAVGLDPNRKLATDIYAGAQVAPAASVEGAGSRIARAVEEPKVTEASPKALVEPVQAKPTPPSWQDAPKVDGPATASAEVQKPVSTPADATQKPAVVRDGLSAVEKVLSPTTVSPEAGATERVIRRSSGQADIDTQRTAQQLKQYRPVVGSMSVDEQRGIVRYIEGASRGEKPPEGFAEPANAVRKVYMDMRDKIQNTLPKDQLPSFITDYYSHLWKESAADSEAAINRFFSRQGSGSNFKKRTIPTIDDGIAAGLTPKIENPIDNTMVYVQNMNRYLATHQIQQELGDLKYTEWHSPGGQPKGWVELDGIKTSKPGRTIIADGSPVAGQPSQKLYAPESVARVYNNFISKGFEQGDLAPFWVGARRASNAMMTVKLGLSAFHLSTMAMESTISGVAKGVGQAARGDIVKGLSSAVKAPLEPVEAARRGLKMEKRLLNVDPADPMSAKIDQAFINSGGRLKMDQIYRTKASGSFFDAMQNGTFKRELGDAFRQLYTGTPYARAKGAVDLAANTLQTVSAPLFEKYIPAIKRGAFSSLMQDWLEAHPNATQGESDAFAIKAQDSIDNRFGELVQDNLFWSKRMKQIAQITLLSPTWDLGTLREIGGGIADIVPAVKQAATGRYQGITPRTAYVVALASTVATANAVATYLKTGTAPEGKDLMAYRTGGTDERSGLPERGMIPGYQKDVYAYGWDFPNNILTESLNKVNPLLKTVTELATNKDYRGLPIYPPAGVTAQAGDPGLLDYLLDQAMPISLGNLTKEKGSNLSLPERMLGIRGAPRYITDTAGTEKNQTKYGTEAWKKRVRSDKKIQDRKEGVP